jgi:hypothetical protein
MRCQPGLEPRVKRLASMRSNQLYHFYSMILRRNPKLLLFFPVTLSSCLVLIVSAVWSFFRVGLAVSGSLATGADLTSEVSEPCYYKLL